MTSQTEGVKITYVSAQGWKINSRAAARSVSYSVLWFAFRSPRDPSRKTGLSAAQKPLGEVPVVSTARRRNLNLKGV